LPPTINRQPFSWWPQTPQKPLMENSLRRAEGWVMATLKMSRHLGQVRAKWRAMVRSHIAAATGESIVASSLPPVWLPAIYARGDYVVIGGLMSYGRDETEPYKRIASMIDKTLKGTKPADIPVEQPMGFELVMNLKTAKALGLTIPPIVLMRVTRVVK
jgi:hypothetical protein